MRFVLFAVKKTFKKFLINNLYKKWDSVTVKRPPMFMNEDNVERKKLLYGKNAKDIYKKIQLFLDCVLHSPDTLSLS